MKWVLVPQQLGDFCDRNNCFIAKCTVGIVRELLSLPGSHQYHLHYVQFRKENYVQTIMFSPNFSVCDCKSQFSSFLFMGWYCLRVKAFLGINTEILIWSELHCQNQWNHGWVVAVLWKSNVNKIWGNLSLNFREIFCSILNETFTIFLENSR